MKNKLLAVPLILALIFFGLEFGPLSAKAITALNAPSNLSASVSNTSVLLSWTASTGGVNPLTYTVSRNGSSLGTTTSVSFLDTGLTASTTYSYIVSVADSSQPTPSTASSPTLFVTTSANPSPLTVPVIQTATSSQTSVYLAWSQSFGGVAPISYGIFRNGLKVATTTQTNFTDLGLTASTTYNYVVQSTDSATPTPVSASSAAVSITTLASNPPTDTTPPVVTIVSPTSGASASGTVAVLVNATDNVAVTRVNLLIDGAVIAMDTSAPYNFSFDSTHFSNGTHSLSAQAFDAQGNMGTSTLVSIVINNPHDVPGSGHHEHEDNGQHLGQKKNGNNGNHYGWFKSRNPHSGNHSENENED